MSQYWDTLRTGTPVEAYLGVAEYSVSHGRRMLVVLHNDNFPWGDHVVLSGVRSFSGRLEGGPYQLSLGPGSEPGCRSLHGVGRGGELLAIEFDGPDRLEKATGR